MAGTKEIKQRIKSVKNTKKITKAMELVSASKMKRAVARTLASRNYAEYSWDLLVSLSNSLGDISHPFFIENEKANRNLLIVITSNSGLCGGYNAQAVKQALHYFKKDNPEEIIKNTDIITVGRKGDQSLRKINLSIIASFTELPINTTLANITPISKLIIDEYKKGLYRNVHVVYTDFISALTQKAQIRKLLPISKKELQEFIESTDNQDKKNTSEKSLDYTLEGNKEILLESISLKLTRMQIYQMILESNASEQSARMIAMKNASEAAGEMISELTLAFNKARQANITQEISEISAGMSSMN